MNDVAVFPKCDTDKAYCFVSYSAKQSELVARFSRTLSDRGVNLWCAPIMIIGGLNYMEALAKGVKNCSLVIAFCSDDYFKAINPKQELSLALENGKTILPVFLEKVEVMEDTFSYILAGKNYIPFDADAEFDKTVNTIIQSICQNALACVATETQPIGVPKVVENAVINTDEISGLKLLRQMGIIINTADGTRNIAFKVETINKMLATICELIASPEKAQEIMYNMGYNSGKKFAESTFADSRTALKNRIDKWCEFDSAAGFGKIENKLNFDMQTRVITGGLLIHDCFVSYRNNCEELCYLLIGYCAGVMEVFLGGLAVCVECASKKSNKCPKDPFCQTDKDVCDLCFKLK